MFFLLLVYVIHAQVPPDYDFWTVLVAGQNVTGTMQRFGHVLRTMHGKDDSYRRSDFTINYLGYVRAPITGMCM